MEVLPCPLGDIRELIETHHYSGSVNGVKVSNCFKVVSDGVVIGGYFVWNAFHNRLEEVWGK